MVSWYERLGLYLLLSAGLLLFGVGCASDDANQAVPPPSGPALVMLYTDN